MSRPLDDVPEPDGADDKEVYAFYGLAAYAGQVLEKGLVNLVAALHTDGLSITRAQFDTLFDKFDSSTFGQLVNAARARIEIPTETEALLSEVLTRRNWLVHDFFAHHSVAFTTDPGRAKMIVELRTLVDIFQRCDREVETLCMPILARRGVTEERVHETEKRMMREYRAATNETSSDL